MFNRIKSLLGAGTQVSKEQLDAQLDQAIETINSGDAAAGVGMMEETAKSLQESAPNSPILAHCCYNAAVSNLTAGDGRRAVHWLRTASDIPGQDHESKKDRLTYLMNLGDILTRMGELEEAEKQLRRGLEERLQFYETDHPGVAFGLTPLAANLLAQKRASDALPLIERAVEINGQAGQPEVASDLALRAFVVKSAGGHEAEALDGWDSWPAELRSAVLSQIIERAEAAEVADEARLAIVVLHELSQRLDDSVPLNDRLNVFVMICNAARIAEDHATRVRFGKKALALAKQTNDPSVVVNIYEGLGMALDDAGKSDEAEKAYKLAYSEAKQAGSAELMANVLRNYGLWCSDKDRHDQASQLLKKAVETAARSDDPQLHGRALAAYGIYLQHQKQFDAAEKALEKCIARLPAAHADRFCAMSHLLALQQGQPCPCDGEQHGAAASAIVEEIVRRSAPPGLLESIGLGAGDEGSVKVQLAREPSEEEMEQLHRVIQLAMAELRKSANPAKFPS